MSDHLEKKKKQKTKARAMRWVNDNGIDNLRPGGFIVITPGSGDSSALICYPSVAAALTDYIDNILPIYLDMGFVDNQIDDQDEDTIIRRLESIISDSGALLDARSPDSKEIEAQFQKVSKMMPYFDLSAQIYCYGSIDSILRSLHCIASQIERDYELKNIDSEYDSVIDLLEAGKFDQGNPKHFDLAKGYIKIHMSDMYRIL